MNDSDLLIQFTQGSDKAFAELVQRHVDLVFAAALRHVAGDRHRAEDIAQQVFIDLARKARTLTKHPTLAGWLYSSTRYTAINTLRGEQRRSAREKQSEVMSTTATGTEPHWEQIRPVIDEAMQELDEDDRQSVLLRFFGQQSFSAIAAQLGISENAAQKRVDRALDRLNVALKRRGISSTAGALGLALADSCVAAPATLAGTVTTAALASAASIGAGTVVVAGWFKIAAAVAVVGVIGWTGVKWSKPEVAEQKQTPLPMPADAKPTQTEVVSNPVPIEEAPKVTEPVPREPVPSEPVQRSAPTPPSPPVRKVFVVQPGNTLKRIASLVGVTPEALSAENPGYNFARMRVGDQVQLPPNATTPTAVVQATSQSARAKVPIPIDQLYIVQPGDTLLKIAEKKGLLPNELEALNPETDWRKLKVGQPIRAP